MYNTIICAHDNHELMALMPNINTLSCNDIKDRPKTSAYSLDYYYQSLKHNLPCYNYRCVIGFRHIMI